MGKQSLCRAKLCCPQAVVKASQGRQVVAPPQLRENHGHHNESSFTYHQMGRTLWVETHPVEHQRTKRVGKCPNEYRERRLGVMSSSGIRCILGVAVSAIVRWAETTMLNENVEAASMLLAKIVSTGVTERDRNPWQPRNRLPRLREGLRKSHQRTRAHTERRATPCVDSSEGTRVLSTSVSSQASHSSHKPDRLRRRPCGPPPLKLSSAMFGKTEETHGTEAAKARGDCHDVTAG